ncbi:MAG: hypothetical protein R3E75_08520 [Steroidobacteraceae bacterium]|nr:hypothetical protein [Nevskiaceae bacterium]MCP5338899.1 hypothetical protein [Nevskiaceae bacterium]MCP5466185.1 hypothetical protein [Nevskiaceae bacterium]
MPDLARFEARWHGPSPPRRISLAGLPGLPNGPALPVQVPGSGGLALLLQAR